MGLRKKMVLGILAGLVLTFCLLVSMVLAGASLVIGLGKMNNTVGRSEEALTDAHGGITTYVPPTGVVPSPNRIELFLSIRRQLAPERRLLQLTILQFRTDSAQRLPGLLDQMRVAVLANQRLAPAYARYWQARNEILLSRGMGPGEYVFLYSLIYYAWLSYDPLDGYAPDGLPIYGYPGGPREWPDLQESEQIRLDHIQTKAWRQVQHWVLPMLENLPTAEGDTLQSRHRLDSAAVALEVERLRESSARVPWRTELPRPLADAFRPFRKDLEDNYALAANPVELVFVED